MIFFIIKYRKTDMILLYDIEYDDDGIPTEVKTICPVLTTVAFESLGWGMIELARDVEDQESVIIQANRLINQDDSDQEDDDD